jgi:hypothetical protein
VRRWLVSLAVACFVWATAAIAHANPTLQRVTIDRVDLEPSPVNGYARLRVFVSAVDLSQSGIVMPVYGDHAWKLQISGGAKSIPYLAGVYDGADADTAIALVVETSAYYKDDLHAIQTALDEELLAKLPARTQVIVIGYGNNITSGSLGSVKNAQAKLASLSPESDTDAPALLTAVGKAMTAVKKAKTDPEGLPVRKLVIVVSDGLDKDQDRTKVTALGKKAAQMGIRIDPIAYATEGESKGPLLNLGELAKQSLGVFRWAQKNDSLVQRIQNAELEIDHEYVLTWLVPVDEVAGKKLSVIAQVSASQAIASNDVKVPLTPTCAGAECPEDGYCAANHCVQHAHPKGRGILGWLFLLVAIAVGAVVAILAIGFAATRLKRKPKPPPIFPGVAPAVPGAAAPAPAAAAPAAPGPVTGPQLYMMTGPRTGERIKLRHGFMIGKQPGCDLVLDQDGFASSQHAQILMDAGGNCVLMDQGSTNGTFVNGVRVTQYALTHGVAIRVGSTELRFLAQ